MILRPETPSDFPAVHRLHAACFETGAEAGLVDRLREDGDAVISLVAEIEGAVAGHVMFSRMRAPFPALGLAPVSVAAPWRRRAIAARLIEAGLDRAREAGWRGVFVLGDPAYYSRFGFSAEAAAGFESPYAGPYLMALSLDGEPLPAGSGRVDYAPAFDGLA